MAIWHDIAARLIRATAGRARVPGAEAMLADTEAGPVRLWVFRGRATGAGGPPPVYIHFPDTGFLRPVGAPDARLARALAEALGITVLLVEVPHVPARRFPVAPTEAQALAWWAMLAGRKLGWNGKRVALGGRGTGAGLALGACLELPARMGVKPAGVCALAPVLDLTVATGWREAVAQAAYLPDRAARLAPLASPLQAPPDSLAGFAPTLIAVAEGDPRRSEGETFAAMLRAAGREVRLEPVPGAEAALEPALAFLRRVLLAES